MRVDHRSGNCHIPVQSRQLESARRPSAAACDSLSTSQKVRTTGCWRTPFSATDPTNADKTIRYGFTVSVGSTPSDGDTFLIEPTRKATENLQLVIQDTRKIAAGAPMALAAEAGNLGTARIGSGAVVATTGLDTAVVDGTPDFGTLTLTYNASTQTFTALDALGAAAAPDFVAAGATGSPPGYVIAQLLTKTS